MSNWIKLNIGGKKFLTKKETLERDPKSFLAKLINDPEAEKDEDGAILVDRDPKLFSVILGYLRNSHIVKSQSVSLEVLRDEAIFYGIGSLVNVLNGLTKKEDSRAASRQYRILLMSLHDAVMNLSEMTEGWKFEQLIRTGSSNTHEEYLYVISKKTFTCPENINIIPSKLAHRRKI